jgi:hypothetical protein
VATCLWIWFTELLICHADICMWKSDSPILILGCIEFVSINSLESDFWELSLNLFWNIHCQYTFWEPLFCSRGWSISWF